MAHIDTTSRNGIPAQIRGGRSKKLTLAVLLATGTMLASASTALAFGNGSDHAILKHMTFQTDGGLATIHVISTDKKKWNALKPGNLGFTGTMSIKAKYPGRIEVVGAALGQCGPHTCSPNAVVFLQNLDEAKEWSGSKSMDISTTKIPVSGSGGIPTMPFGDQIIAKCNQHLAYDGPTQGYSFNHAFKATFIAYSIKKKKKGLDASGLGPTTPGFLVSKAQHAVTDTFSVKIVCDPVPRETAEDVPDDPNFKVTGVKLGIRSPHINRTHPKPGKTCRQALVTVRVPTTKAGPVKFRLWTKVGSGTTQKQFVEAWSSASGSGFEAKYSKWVPVTDTSFVQAWVEELVNPIGHTDGWKSVDVKCTQTPQFSAELPSSNPPTQTPGSAVINPPPAKPGVMVAPLPKLSCAGGKVWKKTCVCPRGKKKVKAGANAYRCIKTVDATDKRKQAVGRFKLFRENRQPKSFGRANSNNSARPAVRRNDRESALRKRRIVR